jgi:hypothetical protein
MRPAPVGGRVPAWVAAREKEGSDRPNRKRAELNRIETFSHCQKRLQRTRTNTTDIGKFVVTFVVTQRLFGRSFGGFTYEKRRGRESNPRIAVLQTATLPLGYPAVVRRDEIIERTDIVSIYVVSG